MSSSGHEDVVAWLALDSGAYGVGEAVRIIADEIRNDPAPANIQRARQAAIQRLNAAAVKPTSRKSTAPAAPQPGMPIDPSLAGLMHLDALLSVLPLLPDDAALAASGRRHVASRR